MVLQIDLGVQLLKNSAKLPAKKPVSYRIIRILLKNENLVPLQWLGGPSGAVQKLRAAASQS